MRGEDAVGLARGVLEAHDILAVAEALAEYRDRVDGAARQMRRVDADDAGRAGRVAQRKAPADDAAPIVADNDRLVDLEMVEQMRDVAGQVFEVVGLNLGRARRRAIAALVGRDDAPARLGESLDLMAPGEGEFRPAVQQDDGRRVGLAGRPRNSPCAGPADRRISAAACRACSWPPAGTFARAPPARQAARAATSSRRGNPRHKAPGEGRQPCRTRRRKPRPGYRCAARLSRPSADRRRAARPPPLSANERPALSRRARLRPLCRRRRSLRPPNWVRRNVCRRFFRRG